MIDKIKQWWSSVGFTSAAYLGIAAASFILFGWPYITGAALGIFVYVNFNTIKKLVQGINI
jgi:hypothetical protein